MPLPDEIDLINYQDVPDLPSEQVVAATWRLLARDNETDEVWEVSPAQLKSVLLPGAALAPPPTVNLAQPLPATVGLLTSLNATASATTGATIARVEFFVGARKIGQATAMPYAVDFAPDSTGDFTVTAKATDSNGNASTSTQTLSVQAAPGSGNLAPKVVLKVSTQSLTQGDAVALTADASDSDGFVERVEFFDFSDKIGESTTAPYALSHTPTTVGTHVYSAKATDNRALSTTTEAIPVVVRPQGQVKPGPPTNVVATAGNGQVVVTATPPTSAGSSPVTGYQVFRNGGGAPLATSVSLPYTDTTAVNGTAYYYELMAHSDAGDSVRSAKSNTVTPTAPTPVVTVPGAPTIGQPTAGNNTVSVPFTPPASNGGAAITSYNIYRSGSSAVLGTTAARPYTDNTALNGTAYTYEVAAVNSAGEGAKSAPSAAVTPAAPVVVPPTYNTTLNAATPIADGMSLAPASSEQLKFNLISGTSGPTVSIAITSLGAMSYIDYASEYAGQGYAFINSAGTRFDGTFPASDNLNIAY